MFTVHASWIAPKRARLTTRAGNVDGGRKGKMPDISEEARALVEAGGFEDDGHDGHIFFFRRYFDGQDQAVFTPDDVSGPYRLSQTEDRNFLSKPKQEDFQTLEESLREAEVWKKDVRVGDDPEYR